jgi:hypothetical protein
MHAAEHDHVVVVYALGATAASIGGRLAALASGVPLGRLGAGALTDADMAALVAAQRRLADVALELVVGQTVSSHDIRAGSLSRDDAPHLIVVDNQALLAHGGRASDLKHLAVDLNVAVLCSTTVPTDRDGSEPADLDGDLLSAADTLTWAAGSRPPRALLGPDDQTATTNVAVGEAVYPRPAARRPT